MSRLSDLLRQVERSDPQLAADLRTEVKALEARRSFGLNFERHVPEAVELPGRPVRRGDKVRVLPQRGRSAKPDSVAWYVASLAADGTTAQLVRPGAEEPERTSVAVDDLVVVAEFRDPIYPGLVSTGKVERGGAERPFHTVINAENFHALEALLYTHEGKVDAIYIDPPYNTGARDWKYNNDYVDTDDAYRHSKWLAFMERRLKLAKRLLNPDSSVLIVTIDEKEYLRLGLLLQQVFPDADLQMISSVINRAGSPRAGRFSRVDEYLYFVFLGRASVRPWTATMLADDATGPATMPTVWFTAVRRGDRKALRSWYADTELFYPVVIDAETGAFHSVGRPLRSGEHPSDFETPPGTLAIWPISNGVEQTWRFGRESMIAYFERGTARLGRRDPTTGLRPVTYLQPGTIKNIENGTFVVTGRSPEGSLELALGDVAKRVVPMTVWNRTAHFARDHGSHMISALLPGRRFPFPKALYAVEDALRFVVSDKPMAVVLDFFAGSGTTAHAVMRLNKQDGGRRQCISVTNNEVGADEQKRLRAQGLRPGDPDWETWGICDYITKPRIEAAITGRTPEGDPIKGDYRFTDEFPMADGFDENVEFFTMTYEAPRAVQHGRSFEAIAPLLWLKAGARGRRIDVPTKTYDVADAYGVLFDVDSVGDFLVEMANRPEARLAYIVTDDERAFQMVCADLPDGVEPVRLYESYLANFRLGGEQ